MLPFRTVPEGDGSRTAGRVVFPERHILGDAIVKQVGLDGPGKGTLRIDANSERSDD
jgi:hypothetical protein